MKKFAMCFVGAVMVLSLAACTPTPEKQAETAVMMETESPGGIADKVPDPNAPALTMISIYSVNKDASGLKKEMDGIEAKDAQAVVDKLIEYGVLEEGTKALSLKLEGEKAGAAGPGAGTATAKDAAELGILDLSQVPTLKESEEPVILAAIGNTFIENFNLDKLKLLVNGKNYTSDYLKQSDEDMLSYIANYETLHK